MNWGAKVEKGFNLFEFGEINQDANHEDGEDQKEDVGFQFAVVLDFYIIDYALYSSGEEECGQGDEEDVEGGHREYVYRK